EGRRLARLEAAAQGGALVYRKIVTHQDGTQKVTEERFAPPDWRADAWVMERRDPQNWGAVQRHQIEAAPDSLGVLIVEGVSLDKALGRVKQEPAPPDTPQGVDLQKALGKTPHEA